MTTLAVWSRFNPRNRSQPRFQPAVIGFDPIVRVLDRRVQRLRCQFTDCFGQRRGPIGDHFRWLAVVTDRAAEEPARGDGVAALRHVHVDDLTMVIDGAVDVTPHAPHLHIGFVDEPDAADGIWERVGRVDQDRGEALHPAMQGDVINGDAALDEEFFQIAVGESRSGRPSGAPWWP